MKGYIHVAHVYKDNVHIRYYAPIYVNIEYCSGSYGQHSNPQYKVIYGQILRMGLHVRGVEAKLWQVHWCRSGWWRRLMVAIMFMTLAGLCYDDNVRLRCGGYNVYNVATTDVTLVGCGMLKKYKRIKHESKAPIDHPLNDSRTTP